MYLIIPKDSDPFLSKWYDYENNYAEGMIVFDFSTKGYTTDGNNWKNIPENHL